MAMSRAGASTTDLGAVLVGTSMGWAAAGAVPSKTFAAALGRASTQGSGWELDEEGVEEVDD